MLQRNVLRYSITLQQAGELKIRMLNWASRFSIHLFLDSNNYTSPYSSYECLLGAGEARQIHCSTLAEVQALHDAHHDWLFGHITYDYKNVIFDRLHTSHPATGGFAPLMFFIPETVCYITPACNTLVIESFRDPAAVYSEILGVAPSPGPLPALKFTTLFLQGEYMDVVNTLRQHIEDGDCYEINFCNAGYCLNALIDPLTVFTTLNGLSPAPFAAYYRNRDNYMMCASPERYLKKNGSKIMSQPIKGTARRSMNAEEDSDLKNELFNSIKERAENVMIVDLVRNDLARSCETGSVNVDELFGIYSYPQVHQMISTVSGVLRTNAPFADAIKYSFPMGSMTGAPKYKVMQLIDTYERRARNLFSGSVGYITPSGDFDFNVIIRSLFYNAHSGYLHYQAGGAITYDSIPQQEWDEMQLKAWAMERIFS